MIPVLYDLLFLIPLSVSVISFVHPAIATGQEEVFGFVWLLPVVFSVLCVLLRRLKLQGRMITGGIAAAVFLASVLIQPGGERLVFLKENAWVLVEIIIVIGCFFVSALSAYYKAIKYVIAGSGCAALAVLLLNGFEVSKLVVCVIHLYGILVVTDISLKGKSIHLVSLSPFLLIFFVLAIIKPVPDKPYDWGFVHSIYGAIQSAYIYFNESFMADTPWDSGDPAIGFSDRGDFGGSLTGADYIVMEFTSINESDPKVYLSGISFDSFDGKEWDKSEEGLMDERPFDTIETLCAAMDAVGEGDLSDLVKSVSATIRYRSLHTKAVFMPAKLLPGGGKDVEIRGYDRRFEKKKRAPYTLVYYRINRGSEEFEELLKSGHKVSDIGWEAACKRLGMANPPSFEEYRAYRKMINDIYLPETKLSPELKTYMDEVMDGADSDYEKLLRIEELLSQFRYTDSPGPLPEELSDAGEFLDYFVLEKREGYCSYFATAFVLLARAYDIPARYIQGFCVPMGIVQHKEISSELAHAWPEAYIDGVGWFAFEPTPGMKQEAVWATAKDRDESSYHGTDIVNENEKHESDGTVDEVIPEEKKPLQAYQFIVPVMSGLGIALLLLALAVIINRIRYLRMDERQKMLWLCRQDMGILGRLWGMRNESETVSEYAARVEERIFSEYRSGTMPQTSGGYHDGPSSRFAHDYINFMNDYERIVYGDEAVTSETRKAMEEKDKLLRKFAMKTRWVRIKNKLK